MKKKFLYSYLIVFLLSCFVILARADSLPSINVSQLETGNKILRVGRIPNFVPFYIENHPNAPGLDDEVFAEVAKRANIKKIQYVNYNNFTELNQALSKGDIDIIVNDYWDVPAHRQFLLTEPYYLKDGIAYAYVEQRNHFNNINDLKNKPIGASQEATDVVNWVKSQADLKQNLVIYPTRQLMMNGLENGKIDAAFVYYTLFMSLFHNWIQTHSIKVVNLFSIDSVFAVRVQDTLLAEKLNKAINSMWADGSLFAIKKKYLNPIGIEPTKTKKR